MFGFGSGVRLTDPGARHGSMQGEFGRYRWEARVTPGPVSYGLNPATLYKGRGRIARLVLYERIDGTRYHQKVAAYDQGWQYGRQEHLTAVRRVVEYLAKYA